jgi:hypothetical protein
MSLPAITWAFKQNLRPAERFVLVALADCANDESRAFPSIKALVAKTGHGRRTVLWALQRLKNLGLIEDTGERLGRTKQVKIYLIPWTPKGAEAALLKGAKSAGKGAEAALLEGVKGAEAAPGTVSTLTVREPKRQQLSEFLEILKADLQYDGIDIEEEYSKAQRWYLEKKLRLTRRGFYKWLDKELQDTEGELEEDEELATETPYYSWEGWTDQRRRALLDLWPGATLPPQRWDKVSPDVKCLIDARVKEGWPA